LSSIRPVLFWLSHVSAYLHLWCAYMFQTLGKHAWLGCELATSLESAFYCCVEMPLGWKSQAYSLFAWSMVILPMNASVIFRNSPILILRILILIQNSIIDKQVCKIWNENYRYAIWICTLVFEAYNLNPGIYNS